MCIDAAIWEDPSSLQYVPDRFVTREGLCMWHDDHYWDVDDNLFKWYNGYRKPKAQKAKIKEELLPIAWHPSRW